jgi:hypothetical protein
MTIEAKTNYFGLFTGRAKRIEPDQSKPIVLEETWPNRGSGRYSEIRIVNDNTVVLRKGHTQTNRKGIRSIYSFPQKSLKDDKINKAMLRTERDFWGRKKIFSYKP